VLDTDAELAVATRLPLRLRPDIWAGVNLTTCYLFFMPHAPCTMYTHWPVVPVLTCRILTEREASIPAHSVVRVHKHWSGEVGQGQSRGEGGELRGARLSAARDSRQLTTPGTLLSLSQDSLAVRGGRRRKDYWDCPLFTCGCPVL
jgi:hypothetical protein